MIVWKKSRISNIKVSSKEIEKFFHNLECKALLAFLLSYCFFILVFTAPGRVTRKQPIRFTVKANKRCNPKYSTKRACMRAVLKGEHSDECNCFEG